MAGYDETGNASATIEDIQTDLIYMTIDLNEDGLWDIITGQTNIRNAGIKNRLYVFVNQFQRAGSKSIRFLFQLMPQVVQ